MRSIEEDKEFKNKVQKKSSVPVEFLNCLNDIIESSNSIAKNLFKTAEHLSNAARYKSSANEMAVKLDRLERYLKLKEMLEEEADKERILAKINALKLDGNILREIEELARKEKVEGGALIRRFMNSEQSRMSSDKK